MQDVPKIVLKGLQSPPAESHPEADLLTAFAEHALVGRERDRIVEHLARCGDCRDVVMLALPATETLATPAPSGGRITWLSWPVLRWGVVAAGIVAVTSIGVLQYMRDHQEKIVASNSMHRYAAADTTAQNAPVPQASASQQAVPKATQRMRKDLSAAPFPQSTLAEREVTPPGARFTAVQPMSRAGSAGVVGGTLGGTSAGIGSGAGPGLNAAPRADTATASAAQNPTPGKPQSPPPASTQEVMVSGANNEVVEVQSEAPQINTETASLAQTQDQFIQNQKQLPLNGRNVANLDAVAKSKNPVPAQAAGPASAPLASPSIPLQTSPALLLRASPRWAISSAGTLQRSFDAGKTWEDISPSANFTSSVTSTTVESTTVASRYKAAPDMADQAAVNQTASNQAMKKQQDKASPNSSPVFRAVAAAGLEVWAGGSAGALYHSVDSGNHWTLVLASAAGTILTGDITSIQFADPQHGTVATSNQEIWTTADNGQTWHKQK